MPKRPWELTHDEIIAAGEAAENVMGYGEYAWDEGTARAAQRKLVQWLEPQLGSDYHNQMTYITLDSEVWDGLRRELGLNA